MDEETVKELNQIKMRLNEVTREMNDYMGETRGRLDKIERIITTRWGKLR